MSAAKYMDGITLKRAALVLAAAVVLGALSAGQALIGAMQPEYRWTPGHALIMQTPFWLFWALLFPVIIVVARRISMQRDTLRTALPAHLAIGLAIAILHFTITYTFMGLIGHGTWAEDGHSYTEHYGIAARHYLVAHIITYGVILGGITMWEYYRKFRERELLASQLAAQLSQARLEALRMQLNPHFLFNAMNSIAMLVRRNDTARAVKMLAGLSDLLRYVLADSSADEVPLREELQFVERYLEIERVRFQDRLKVRLDTSDDTLDAHVPNLVLQPLVENAVKHGIGRKVSGGTIEIAARRLGDRLIMQVSDDGAGMAPLSGSGVGLTNTRSRLDQLYGNDAGFELRAGRHGGAVATISLPYHTQPLTAGVTAA